MKKKRRINYEKIFCFVSLIFVIICILWYGGRFVYFYLDSKKSVSEKSIALVGAIRDNIHDKKTLRKVNDSYYFYKDVSNNYVSYSNMVWRVLKVNKDDTVTLVTDNNIGTLRYGDKENAYEESDLVKWLNDKMENGLNNKNKYLIKSSTCIDDIDDIKNIECKSNSNKSYLNIISVEDYLYTGGNNSFINNKRNSYLSNKNKDKDIWYITDSGKIDTTDGEDIMGIKAVITLNKNILVKGGNGTAEEPYFFEDNNIIMGSFVKLDNDLWRVYEEKDNLVKLVLNSTLSVDNKEFKHIYSRSNYYHNDTIKGSLANYLNTSYYNSLSYKDIVRENSYSNYYYDDYSKIKDNTIETKVSVPSIDDIIYNDTLDEYYTNTGLDKTSKSVYLRNKNGLINYKSTQTENKVVPCITIDRTSLKSGNGTEKEPYRMEE